MALATRPRSTVHHKKRQGQHHRHSKTYISTYWPYLPMLAIVGVGAIVNKLWVASSFAGASVATLNPNLAATQGLTRVQLLTNTANQEMLAVVIAVTFAAFAVFLGRHSLRLHRALSRGEAFVSDHPWLDIVSVFVITSGCVLTRVVVR